tara:strand:- start:7019 stop:7165 length:147 start_codon:yes stop_codon:yes gene_type:complete
MNYNIQKLKYRIQLLEKAIQLEVKEKYNLYKRIKHLNEEIEVLKKNNG